VTTAIEQLLQAFDALTDAEKHQVTAEILRSAAQITPTTLPDEALVEAADELFRELDEREAADARP
jgi:hypothetical protein